MGIILNQIRGLGSMGRRTMGKGFGRTLGDDLDNDLMGNASRAMADRRFMDDAMIALGISGACMALTQSDKKK